MASELTLMVNGAQHIVLATPETPLLYVLRNESEIDGPRFGCGLAQCGACAVLVNGKEVRSDLSRFFRWRLQVTTIEGLPAVWAAENARARPTPPGRYTPCSRPD